jgi:FkbM family methyltransferase
MNNMTNGADAAVLAAARRHPAVAETLITTDADGGTTVWIVPDPVTAPMLHRSAAIEDSGRLGVLHWHEPADGLRVAGINRRETDFLFREIFADGAYYRRGITLPAGAVVVDVGANIGMFTLRTAMLSPGGRILAIEPVAELADAVRINAELHDADVGVVCAALGDAESEAEFTFYPHNSVMSGRFADPAADRAVLKGYLLTDEDSPDEAQLDRLVADRLVGQRRRVPVTTLTAVAERYGVDHVDLLKIDVENAEMQVLAGVCERLWPRIDRIVAEVHDIDGRLSAVIDLLQARGFRVETDQDPRLTSTPCHSVYAYRSDIASGTLEPAPHRGGPTVREVERDLRQAVPGATIRRVIAVRELAAAEWRAGPVVAPRPDRTREAAVLAEAWAALFGADAVRPDANFFDVGGTSLTALRLLERVEKELGEGVLTLESIFATDSFAELAATVGAGRPAT